MSHRRFSLRCFGLWWGVIGYAALTAHDAFGGGPPALRLICSPASLHFRSVAQLHLDMDALAGIDPEIAKVVDYGDSYLKTVSGGSSAHDLQALRMVKRLLGEGCNARIWDPHVSMGRIIGSNRTFPTSAHCYMTALSPC